jgi:hypothetical protein
MYLEYVMELKDLFKLSAITLALTMTAACDSDDDKKTEEVVEVVVELTAEEELEAEYLEATGETADIEIISGTITSDMTLTADKIYALSGPVAVGNDNEDSTILSIDPGVTIFGETGNDYLVISRGSQIEAEGTATDPITMTSKADVLGETVGAGQWGGLVILGNASSNKCPDDGTTCSLQVEGAFDGAVFGGTDDEDNSGTLNYLVIKYAGYEIESGNELNGITFGGVGSGTEVDYVQVHANADDGVEFFGGTVDVKHLVLTENQDDSVDWDNGYRGNMQFVLIKQHETGDANRGIEADNDGSTPELEPFSNPTISNMTIIGGSFDGDDDSEGIYLREGTKGSFYNVIVTNAFGECLEVEGNSVSQGHLEDGEINFHSSVIACDENFKNGSTDDFPSVTMTDLSTWWTASATNSGNSTADDMAAVLNGIFTIDTTAVTQPTGTFFDTVDFIGAVKDSANDWTAGWAVGLED